MRRVAWWVGLSLLPCACASVLGIDDPLPLRDAGAAAADGSSDGPATAEGSTDEGSTDGSASAEASTEDGSTDGSTSDAAPDASDAGGDSSVTPDASGACEGICVPTVPAPWTGPFAYSVTTGGTPQPTPPPCAAPYSSVAADYKRDLNAPPATCGCTCDGATGVTCSAPTITFFSDPACTSTCGTASQSVGATCGPFDRTGCPANAKGMVATSVASGGSCNPRPTVTVPQKTWGTAVRLCAVTTPADGTCTAGQVCAAQPGLGQTAGALCIAATGNLACPADYPAQQTVYTDATDTRDCTQCTCGGATGATCSAGTVSGYDSSPTCTTGGTHTLTQGGGCGPAGTTGLVTSAPTPSAATCPASPVSPTGAAAPVNATTICCTR